MPCAAALTRVAENPTRTDLTRVAPLALFEESDGQSDDSPSAFFTLFEVRGRPRPGLEESNGQPEDSPSLFFTLFEARGRPRPSLEESDRQPEDSPSPGSRSFRGSGFGARSSP